MYAHFTCLIPAPSNNSLGVDKLKKLFAIHIEVTVRGRRGKMGHILEISILSLIHEIFRTSFNLLLMVGIQALLSKGLLDNCKHSRVNSCFTKISKRPILPRCLGQDEHDMDLLDLLKKCTYQLSS